MPKNLNTLFIGTLSVLKCLLKFIGLLLGLVATHRDRIRSIGHCILIGQCGNASFVFGKRGEHMHQKQQKQRGAAFSYQKDILLCSLY